MDIQIIKLETDGEMQEATLRYEAWESTLEKKPEQCPT
jgi:hypothetical protein